MRLFLPLAMDDCRSYDNAGVGGGRGTLLRLEATGTWFDGNDKSGLMSYSIIYWYE